MSNDTSASALVLTYTAIQESTNCPANLIGAFSQGLSFSVPFDIGSLPASITLTTASEQNFMAAQQVTLLQKKVGTAVLWEFDGSLSATVFGQPQTITQVVLSGSGGDPSGWSSSITFGAGCVVVTGSGAGLPPSPNAGGTSQG